MLAYIKGTLEMKMTGYVVIDVGGLRLQNIYVRFRN